MSRFLRRLFTRSGPRFCRVCGSELTYTALVTVNEQTGRPKRWHWAAACPTSSILFKGPYGSWSGNGHAYTHDLFTVTGPPLWYSPMRRALTLHAAVAHHGTWGGYGSSLVGDRG